jgi:uncharacterized protein
MIDRTFAHLPGIGPRREAALRAGGFTWERFLTAQRIHGISPERKISLDRHLRADVRALGEHEWSRFTAWPLALHHRALPHLNRIVYLDIETYGVKTRRVALIAVSDGDCVRILDGSNTDRSALEQTLSRAEAIVTYNGNRFDLPYLERATGYHPTCFTIDLEPLARRAGLVGGLKRIERALGIERDHDYAGGDPLALWRSFRATGDEHFLELLTAYIEQDVESLPILLDHVLRSEKTAATS